MEQNQDNVTKKYLKRGIITSIIIILIILAVHFLVGNIPEITIPPELIAWPKSPVSEMKIWQLAAMLWVISRITSEGKQTRK